MSSKALISIADPQKNLHKVFVYGTLLADEVIRILLNRIPHSSAAVLHRYQRLSIKGRVYPAIIPVDNKKISGKVLLGITDTEMDILDTFEDVDYKRSIVEVSLMDTLEKLLVYAYVWYNENDPDLHGDWDFEEWKRVHLDAYVKMTTDFMEGLEQPNSDL